MNFLSQNWGWIFGGLVVAVGLLGFGLADVSRFSISRCWAISGVCFDESIRKKVLWITPLAIAGVIVVSQLQKALDEQDAIRQTIKFCLFASGMVVVLSSLILACTNLPKEIESRVIFTIVTKPTTRLEVIVGKVMGFARVSGAILVIMGLFTWGYLLIRERGQMEQITSRVAEGAVSDTERARLIHYSQTGLLSARELWAADELQVMGERPDLTSDKRIIHGDQEEDLLVGFAVTPEMFPNGPESGAGDLGLVIRVRMDWARTGAVADSPDPDQMPVPVQLGPYVTTQPAPPPRPPAIDVSVSDEGFFDIIPGTSLAAGITRDKLLENIRTWVADKDHSRPTWNGARVRLQPEGETGYTYAWIPPTLAGEKLYGRRMFYVAITGANQNVNYVVGKEPVQVFLPQVGNGQTALDQPPAKEIARVKNENTGMTVPLIFHGRMGTHGEQEMQGTAVGPMAAAIYTFHGAPTADVVTRDVLDAQGATHSVREIPFEIANLQIQRSNESDNDEAHEDPTNLLLTVHDVRSGRDTPVNIQVETRQTTFFTVPADAITGPDYDIIMQCSNTGHTVGFYPESLQLITGRQNFGINLVKSLSILWMMSILVIIVSIMCSTFLSWPIAIVLTVILLMGHWGVNQVSDVNGPGLGRQMGTQLGIGDKDAAVNKVFTSSVDALSETLNTFAKILPDTEGFDAIANIEQGTAVSWAQWGAGLKVLIGFGAPSIVLAYLLLKIKEVAP